MVPRVGSMQEHAFRRPEQTLVSSQEVSARAWRCLPKSRPVHAHYHPKAVGAKVLVWLECKPPLLSFHGDVGQRTKALGIRPFGILILAKAVPRLGI